MREGWAPTGVAKRPMEVGDLEGHPFFAALDAPELVSLAGIGRVEEVAAGDVILREGDDADAFRVLSQGRVSLKIDVPGRDDLVVATISRGKLLGWSSLLPQSRWVATATAVKPTLVLVFPAVALLALCDDEPRLGYRIARQALQTVSHRLHDTRLQMLDMFGGHG